MFLSHCSSRALRLSLMGQAAAIALLAGSGNALAQTLPANAFQQYDPANSAAIQPGLFSLFAVPVDELEPTQPNVGDSEVAKKTADWNLLDPSQLQATLLGDVETVVIGPGGQLYQTNGHHTFLSLEDSKFGASNPTVFVNVVANFSNDTPAQFLADLQKNGLIYPVNNGVLQTVTPGAGTPPGTVSLSPLPSTLAGLTNDPDRGLEFSVLKNKFPGGVSEGFDKTSGAYSDFLWANAYRNAITANGTGLAFASPADVNNAAKFSQNAASQTVLPGVGQISIGQMPGFILQSSIVLNGTISDQTLAGGALDGTKTGTFSSASQASFNGINGLTLGPNVVEQRQPGFVMQLGADSGNTVTLNGNNTYHGGTTILAGTLIAGSDAALGAAPTGGAIDPNNVAASVQANNGIVFNSLTEGAGTLRFGTGFTSTARDIAIGSESATLDPNGNTVTLTGQLASFNLGEGGVAPLTINDNTGKGTLILAPTSGSNPLFFGNIVISAGTLEAASDAALGNTTGPAFQIGQIDLDGGTFKAGGNISSVRSLFLTGSSSFDTNGFNSSFAGPVTDVQRTLTVLNSGTTAGTVTFGSLEIGATATLAVQAGSTAAATTTVDLTNGITRDGNATLFLDPASGKLGTTERVFSAGASTQLTNGIVAPWITIDSGAKATSNPYDFATYSAANGYTVATYSPNAITASSATDVVKQAGTVSLTKNAQAYALNVQNGATINLGSNTLTIGDGTNPAGLIMNGSAALNGGTLAFGASEAVLSLKSTNTISSTITGSGGLTLSGSGSLALTTVTQETGAVVVDSGTLTLSAQNALAGASSVTLEDVKKSPAPSILALTATNSFGALNSAGNNSTVQTSNGAALIIGDGRNRSSTLSSAITETGAAVSGATQGAITKNGTGMLDLSGASKGTISLVSGSDVVVNGGQLRIASNVFANPNAIVLNNNSELQLVQGGGGALANNISGTGDLHLMSGTLQLTGTNNTYSGGTILEVGAVLDTTTANLSSTNANITSAGGVLVLDQATNGSYTGVMSDGVPTGGGTVVQAASLVKDDSSGANGGNVTITQQQNFSGSTSIEAGTLTLAAKDTLVKSSGVDLGRVGGGSSATLAIGADNTLQALSTEANNVTALQLNGHTLTVNSTIQNAAQLNLANTTGTIQANIANNGAVQVSGSNIMFGGTFTNNGGFVTEGATISFGNLVNTMTGTIQASAGDTFKIAGNFTNTAQVGSATDISKATFAFTPGIGAMPTAHTMTLGGLDLGQSAEALTGDFLIGTLDITGQSLTLASGNTIGKAALYVDTLTGAVIDATATLDGLQVVDNITGDGFNIYYNPLDDLALGGLDYALLGGGELIADVPEPASWLVILPGLAAGFAMVRRRARKS